MELLKDKKGMGYIFPCVITVILCMIAAVVIFFTVTVSMIRTQREDTKKVLDSFVIENAIEVYDSVKMGEDEQLSLNSTAFIDKLCSFCYLDKNGDMLYCYDADGNLKYALTEPELSANRDLKITAKYMLSVPIYFNGSRVTTAEIPISINAYYTEKF